MQTTDLKADANKDGFELSVPKNDNTNQGDKVFDIVARSGTDKWLIGAEKIETLLKFGLNKEINWRNGRSVL